MTDLLKLRAIQAILDSKRLDALVVSGVFNVRYVSGAWIPMAHAQPDRPMLVVVRPSGQREMIVPIMWESVARECAEVDAITTITADHGALHGTAAALTASLPEAGNIRD